MPRKPPKVLDVWLVASNTVYKSVPYHVVADWTQQGRLAGTDRVRPAGGSAAEWELVRDHPFLADYLPRPSGVTLSRSVAPSAPAARPLGAAATPSVATSIETTKTSVVELPEPESSPAIRRFEEDDEVDMIPLIDISMVLLVFFIMIQAAGALAPVDVPEMHFAGELTADPNAITITIEKTPTDDIRYAIRVGNSPPQSGQDELRSPGEVLNVLNSVLSDYTTPPEVRIACHKDLPRKWVYELRRDLEDFRKKGKISNTVATVVEAPESQ
ncbi:MAG: biopolymer transporter ExbD [Gemmataceae bacterium]|nr:biopolymer transporter ExbD [Gemmata sp.]MDW8196993.1 biopolymer transporter ExbD [Gemmataceae bacterium]